MTAKWDAIVVGSGMGGLTAAAALAHSGRRVLILERHSQAGGLTQTFVRDGFRFNVGMHSLGGFGAGQPNRRLVDALAGDRLKMRRVESASDRVSFPGCTVAFDGGSARYDAALLRAFPEESVGIQRYMEALSQGEEALNALLAARCASPLVGSARTWLKHRSIERWAARTTQEVVHECVASPQARAVLCARWGDYGSVPAESSFALHAAVTRRYFDGAWYPEGGPGSFANAFGATVTAAGGMVRTGAEVEAIGVDRGRVLGVQLTNGETIPAEIVVSDIGVRNTLRRLPSQEVDYRWAREGYGLQPSVGAVLLHIGLEGDIAAHGATPTNDWIYDSWDVNALWEDPHNEARAPALFVSFPSLRDPSHDPGPRQLHVCELVAPVAWRVFAPWDRTYSEEGMRPGTPGALRPPDYVELKGHIESCLLRQFTERFPELGPCVRWVEASSPVSLATFTGAEHGAMYGLQTTPARFFSPALRPRTPIRGLYLAGQDVAMPGVMGAAMGGLMAAASIEPALWKLIRD